MSSLLASMPKLEFFVHGYKITGEHGLRIL